ncbi:hypothetical protein HRbin19_01095 [bacterium HR19]|nr:hypothetical protein HRbin19_01095 [bacterium HR19]
MGKEIKKSFQKIFSLLTFLFIFHHSGLSDIKITHIGINTKPTFSYVSIHLDSPDFSFSYNKKENLIVVVIDAKARTESKVVEPKDKFIKKLALVRGEVEGGKEKAIVQIILRDPNLEWNVIRSRNEIIVFVGRSIPFYEKDFEKYVFETVRSRNYSALDNLFFMAGVGDDKTKALAYFGIAELLFKMGVESNSSFLLYRASLFYGTSADFFYKLGDWQNYAISVFKSSTALRWGGFFIESAGLAQRALDKIQKVKSKITSKIYLEIYSSLLCSASLGLVGMNKAGSALLFVQNITSDFSSFRDDVKDCIWASAGAVEYEKGNFYDSAEKFTYVSEKFLLKDPVVLPRYADSLLKINNFELARKYFIIMTQHPLYEVRAKGYLGAFKVFLGEGKGDMAIRYIYKAIDEFSGSFWEVRARLLAVQNRDKLKNFYSALAKKSISKDDPIYFPEENLRFIISSFLFPESQIAVYEYIKLLNEKLKADKFEDIENSLDSLFSSLSVLGGTKVPADIKENIREKNYELLNLLVKKQLYTYAYSLYSSFSEFLPPDYLKDYSSIISEFRKYGFLESEDDYEKIVKEFYDSQDKQSFVMTHIKDFPKISINYIEYLVQQGECQRAYNFLLENESIVKNFPEYSDMIFILAYCLFTHRDELLLADLCQKYKTRDIEDFCKYEEFLGKVTGVMEIIEFLESVSDRVKNIREQFFKLYGER